MKGVKHKFREREREPWDTATYRYGYTEVAWGCDFGGCVRVVWELYRGRFCVEIPNSLEEITGSQYFFFIILFLISTRSVL